MGSGSKAVQVSQLEKKYPNCPVLFILNTSKILSLYIIYPSSNLIWSTRRQALPRKDDRSLYVHIFAPFLQTRVKTGFFQGLISLCDGESANGGFVQDTNLKV